METMIWYLAKASVILLLLYLFFHYQLTNSGKFQNNRMVLLTIVLASLLIPLSSYDVFTKEITLPNGVCLTCTDELSIKSNSSLHTGFNWVMLLLVTYIIGFLFFGLRFFYQLFKLISIIFTSHQKLWNGCRIIETKELPTPSSFFHWIIVEKEIETHSLILEHEKIHAVQFHSIDILLCELLKAVLWFHPASYLMLRTVKENHEFICDAQLLLTTNKEDYSLLLLSWQSKVKYQSIINQFSSFIKKKNHHDQQQKKC